jgi:hypothetical protein
MIELVPVKPCLSPALQSFALFIGKQQASADKRLRAAVEKARAPLHIPVNTPH